ncbi:SH3 domain-containing protein [Bacillus ndiopicus]|uniref:SH3 domain-containing protein n=1 Tax=Bacillus ndiopicus TaxID=1347368 RepID=UPI0005A60B84|nr:SH3 domain-containing protein [Bacillus ndiopicus]
MKALRFIVALCLLVLLVGEVSQVKAYSGGHYKYVSANSGDLILRAEPNSKGAKVTMLKSGSKVFVYSTDKNGWSHIKQGKYKGYTKDSFLVTKLSERTIDFSMTIEQVQKSESATLINKSRNGEDIFLTYLGNHYGYSAKITYHFVNYSLDMVFIDFLPDKDSYNTWSEMEDMYYTLYVKTENVEGEASNSFIRKFRSLLGTWEKGSHEIFLNVNDEKLYTEVVLVYSK